MTAVLGIIDFEICKFYLGVSDCPSFFVGLESPEIIDTTKRRIRQTAPIGIAKAASQNMLTNPDTIGVTAGTLHLEM